MEPALLEPARCVAPVAARLGEGPLWDPRIAQLLFLDIKGGRLFVHDPERGDTQSFAVDGMVSALGLAADGGYVCAYEGGFARLELDGDAVRLAPLHDPEPDRPGNRFNDGKVDPRGGFWAGSMDDAERATTGAWWRLDPAGDVGRLLDGFHVTNGPAFDSARGRVYLTDSAAQTVFVAESDGGRLANRRVFLQFGAGDGYPDGMEVDAEGCLWIAFWDGAAVRRLSPDGALLETLPLPVPRPTSVVFAGDRLFITSASIGLDQAALAAAPLSGGVFEARLSRPLSRPPAFYAG